jgi:hypothetical protein
MTKLLPMAMANIFFCLLLLSSLIASPLEATRIVHEHYHAHIIAGISTTVFISSSDLTETNYPVIMTLNRDDKSTLFFCTR